VLFLVRTHQSGPSFVPGEPLESQSQWTEHAEYLDGLVADGVVVLGGPLSTPGEVALVLDLPSEDDVRQVLAEDPWAGSHLEVGTIEGWTIRLDGRRGSS
jgi:uncharacterized protein YciI